MGAVKLTKNADIDKYKYFGFAIGFDKRFYSHPSGQTGRNVVMLCLEWMWVHQLKLIIKKKTF